MENIFALKRPYFSQSVKLNPNSFKKDIKQKKPYEWLPLFSTAYI